MPKVTSRNIYSNTSFYLITFENGDFKVKNYYNVGQKQRGIDFINETKNVSKGKYVLVGPHLDSGYDIEPTIITDIDEQRMKVLEHLKSHYVTFNPDSVDM